MDTLFGTSHQDSILSWSLCAQFGGKHNPVNFRLERQDSGKWKAYSDEIEASLSLWLYSVNQMEGNDSSSSSSKPSIEDDAWHRAKGSSLKRSLRVLGSRTDILSRNLEWWMPIEAASISEVGNEEEEVLTEVEAHRVVGSGVRCWFEGDNASTGVNKNSRRMLLITETYNSLKLLYAQDIFSTFMWTAAKLLPTPMSGVADIRPIDDTNGADSWQSFKFQNQQLSKMVQDIQNTGLGNASDIYLSVVPSLGVRQKLPEAEAIIGLARDQAKRYEQLGQLTKAGHIYEWLFETVSVFEPENLLCVRATAVLVEHLRQLTLTIQLKTLDNDERDLKNLKSQIRGIQQRVRDNITVEGTRAVSGLVSNLEKMYEAQGRGWECSLLEQERSEIKVEPEIDLEFDE
ncbi:Ff.00g062950.m01.CDS01 [Fusarium sp. VM40]|nr:Ff.00g062950.m01.CDS01 [Fusarium sp. VM40]